MENWQSPKFPNLFNRLAVRYQINEEWPRGVLPAEPLLLVGRDSTKRRGAATKWEVLGGREQEVRPDALLLHTVKQAQRVLGRGASMTQALSSPTSFSARCTAMR